MTLRLVGRELCFWCVETHRGCHLHENSNVFWNDVSIRGFTDDDGFEIVDEREIVNLERKVQFTAGQFFMPPTSASIPISSNTKFHFAKCEDPEIRKKYQVEAVTEPPPPPKITRIEKKPKCKKSEKPLKKAEKNGQKRTYYSKIHKNAVKTIPSVIYTKGKKCDLSQKMFVCDICELSFTLRHNLQVHLLAFHGDAENMTEEIVSKLKKTRPKKDCEE